MTKYMLTTMPNGSTWAVPTATIAEHRARYYAENDPDFKGDFNKSLNEDTLPLFNDDWNEISDWASNNMNWSDVESVAFLYKDYVLDQEDYQEGWVNGDKDFEDLNTSC